MLKASAPSACPAGGGVKTVWCVAGAPQRLPPGMCFLLGPLDWAVASLWTSASLGTFGCAAWMGGEDCHCPHWGGDGSGGSVRAKSFQGYRVVPEADITCSVTQSCPTLPDPMNCTRGYLVLHHLPEFAQRQGQGSLMCCSPPAHEESDTTEHTHKRERAHLEAVKKI